MEIANLQRLSNGATPSSKPDAPSDTAAAARDFEAMLIGELLKSAYSTEQTGLGGGSDSGGQTMLDFGREHLAKVISAGGGLGLAKVVENGLKR